MPTASLASQAGFLGELVFHTSPQIWKTSSPKNVYVGG